MTDIDLRELFIDLAAWGKWRRGSRRGTWGGEGVMTFLSYGFKINRCEKSVTEKLREQRTCRIYLPISKQLKEGRELLGY